MINRQAGPKQSTLTFERASSNLSTFDEGAIIDTKKK